MAHPFDDPEAAYRVLVNGRQQHSLWPDGIAVPAGWTPVFGPDTRDACTGYVEAAWTDMRPAPIRTVR
ncbi:MbtH family protein [Streptomyces bryophytorum]|nr:MbtH family protein [Actinacidiphila bryophytorum]MBM9438326.1 MbtH family protein [Actinacidiphila bryophytorum]MBN6542649.1 MbtH family protein [Actinacidiphila bryophytorum]